MSDLLKRFVGVLRRGEFRTLLAQGPPHLHKFYVRQYLPRRPTTLNGVTVRRRRLFDRIVPWSVDQVSSTHYESALVSGLREHVTDGDDVLVVGGGWGVTTVIAARQVGTDGSVRTFEGSPTFAEYVSETATLNGVERRVEVDEAVVSHGVSVRGTTESDTVVDPASLPRCDVLELDCEGSELRILKQMSIQPRVVLVEAHGVFGSPTEAVTDQLRSLGYEINSTEPAESGPQRDACEEDDIYVVVASRDTSP